VPRGQGDWLVGGLNANPAPRIVPLEIVRLTTVIVTVVASPPSFHFPQSAVIVWSVCDVIEQV
jgi:hypothetical protein